MLIGAALSTGIAETTIMSLFAVPAAISVLALIGVAICARKAS